MLLESLGIRTPKILNPFETIATIGQSAGKLVGDLFNVQARGSAKVGQKPVTQTTKHYAAGQAVHSRKKMPPRVLMWGGAAREFVQNDATGYGPVPNPANTGSIASAVSRWRAESLGRFSFDGAAAVMRAPFETIYDTIGSALQYLSQTDAELYGQLMQLSKDAGGMSSELHKIRLMAEEVGSSLANVSTTMLNAAADMLIDDIEEAPHISAADAAKLTSQVNAARSKNSWPELMSVNTTFRARPNDIVSRLMSSWPSTLIPFATVLAGDYKVGVDSPNTIISAVTGTVTGAFLGRHATTTVSNVITPVLQWFGESIVEQRLGARIEDGSLGVRRVPAVSPLPDQVVVDFRLRSKGAAFVKATREFEVRLVELIDLQTNMSYASSMVLAGGAAGPVPNVSLGVVSHETCRSGLNISAVFSATVFGALPPGRPVRIKVSLVPKADVAHNGESTISTQAVVV